MKNILLLNGAKKFSISGGELNKTLHKTAKETLTTLGKTIEETTIDSEYNFDEEVKKVLNADAIIFQTPAWWMSFPWTIKKYIDEVYTKVYEIANKNECDIKSKKYMLSLTCEATIEEFDKKDDFFEGFGVDGIYLHFHKIHEFIGMSKLPTFVCSDVIKNPNVELFIENYKEHLKKVFA